MMLTIVVAVLAFLAAFYASTRLSIHVVDHNRKYEWPENQKGSELSPTEVHWTIVHIRDDIGSLVAVLFFTNGLLAAILGVLICGLYSHRASPARCGGDGLTPQLRQRERQRNAGSRPAGQQRDA